MQLNYFTNCIKINDRFIFGPVDTEVRENNSVYKVKAVIKANSTTTFTRDNNTELETNPLLVLALDKDAINPQDNFQTRVASNSPVYLTYSTTDTKEIKAKMEVTPKGSTIKVEQIYTLKDSTPVEDTILLGTKQDYTLELLCDGKKVPRTDTNTFVYTYELENKSSDKWSEYFTITPFTSGDVHGFTVANLKHWQGGKLVVTATYIVPQEAGEAEKNIGRKYYITLGKRY